LALSLIAIAYPDVFLHAEFGETHLLLREEPMRILRKIGKYEYGDNSDQDCQGAFDEKKPPEVNRAERA
jgi:hypothetical protein